MLYIIYKHFSMGQGSEIDIATCYRLDSPGIEFRWGRNFPALSSPALEPTQWGRGVNNPPSSSSAVKGRVELYLYYPLLCPHGLF